MTVPPPDGPEPKAGSNRVWWFLLAGTVVIALVLRLAYLKDLSGLPFFDQPVGDSAIYLARAREILGGQWLPTRPFFYGSIFYPYYLALLLGPAHGSILTVLFIQVLAGALLVGGLALLGRHLFGTSAGVACGLLAASYGPLAFMEADVLGVIWGLLALLAGMYLCCSWLSAGRRHGKRGILLLLSVGAAFGLSVAERPNLLLLVPLVATWCAWNAATQRVRVALAVLAGAALPVSMYLILNVAGTGEWVPLTTSSGINLSIGYHAGADGTFREPWDSDAEFSASHTELGEASRAMASMRAGRELDARGASKYWSDAAIQFIKSHPRDALRLTVRKILLLLNNVEVPNHLNFEFMRQQAPALAMLPAGFGVVLVLGLMGLAALLIERRRIAESSLLLLVFFGTMLSVVPFFVADRYRAPLVLPLLIAAGEGLRAFWSAAKGGLPADHRRLLVTGLAGSCALAVATLPLARPLEGRDYSMLAQAYESKGALPSAVKAYEMAVQVDSTDATLLNNLGRLYRQTQQPALAVATFRKAIAADSQLVLPYRNLGISLIEVGDLDGALSALREADRLSPDDPQTLAFIGALLAERGDTQASADAFTHALRLAPQNQSVLGLLGRYPAVAREIAQGTGEHSHRSPVR